MYIILKDRLTPSIFSSTLLFLLDLEEMEILSFGITLRPNSVLSSEFGGSQR